MDIITIGNWTVTEEGIKWRGQPDTGLIVPKDELTQMGMSDRDHMYDWLVHLSSKTWITEPDLYTLNTAYIFALVYFGYSIETDGVSFVDIIKTQQAVLKNR